MSDKRPSDYMKLIQHSRAKKADVVMPRTSDTWSLPVSKMVDVFEVPRSKMAANRMTAKYNDEAKNTPPPSCDSLKT